MEEKTFSLPWTKASSMVDGKNQCAYMTGLGILAEVQPYEGSYAVFIDPKDEQDAKEKLGNVVRIH